MRISIPTLEFTAALAVILPFTAGDRDSSPAQPSQQELIFCNITSGGKLAISAHGKQSSFALIFVDLEDTDGEVAEFAIHRDDASALMSHFRQKKKQKDDVTEPSLDITISHEDFREPTSFGSVETIRHTTLEFSEAGMLFDARELRMAGKDTRSHRVREIFQNQAQLIEQISYAPMERYLRPQDTICLNKASSTYGQPLVRLTSEYLLASIGSWFYASFELTRRDEEEAHARGFEQWAQIIKSHSSAFPLEDIYVQTA